MSTRRNIGWATASTLLGAGIATGSWLVVNDEEVWSAIGQWAGGIGAFVAAVVALLISHREGERRRDIEREQDYINAHFIDLQNRAQLVRHSLAEW